MIGKTQTVKAAMTLFIFALPLCAQQTDSNEKVTIPKESPEHVFARQQYEKQTVRYVDNRSEARRLTEEANGFLDICNTLPYPRAKDCLMQAKARLNLIDRLNADLPGIAQLLELLKIRFDHVDECVYVYRNTVDSKLADLTIGQTDLVESCKSVGLYPPQK